MAKSTTKSKDNQDLKNYNNEKDIFDGILPYILIVLGFLGILITLQILT